VIGTAVASESAASNQRWRETGNEVELSVWVSLAAFELVTIIPVLASLGYSSTGVPHRPRNYLRFGELISEELVDAPSTNLGRPVQFMLCTIFLVLRKTLISTDFTTIRAKRERHFCRSKLAQFKVFVNHSSSELIRPEEETRYAGDPT
jgi:hypothetical protein